MEIWVLYISSIIGIGDICLLLALLKIYWQNYKEMKSKFTRGLLFFVSVLLLQTIFLSISPFFRQDVGPILIIYNVMMLIALSVLLKTTW
ncbi:MAG TPA: hypothetical protein VK426_09515 [Methanobacterium sp.]|nr:hypothetical protein [Methanobacterium sp.]